MAVYKRYAGGPYWVKFKHRGKTIRGSSGTRDRGLAEEYEAVLRERYRRQEKLGEVVYTWKQATDRYVKEAHWRKSTRATNEYALTFFTPINSVPVAEISISTVASARAHVTRTQNPSSANRIMAVFRGVLSKCVDWGWLTHVPRVKAARIDQADIAPLTQEEFVRLEAELPAHLKGPARFSVLTGLREANVSGLQWGQVDLVAGRLTIPSSHYKTKRIYSTTLSEAAIAVLNAQPRVSEYVFTYEGERVTRFNNHAFRKARARAGLPNLRWHDLRHTFATWIAQAGASDRVLQQAGGWQSPKMVARYAHLRGDDTLKYATAVGTKLDTAVSDAVALTSTETLEKPRKTVVPSI
jgi:integrase